MTDICSPIDQGYPVPDCYKSKGGVANIYVGNKSDFESYTPALNDALDEGLIEAIALDAGAAQGFYDFTPLKFTASYILTAQENEDLGVVGYDIEVTLPFQKNEADTRNAIKMLRGNDLVVLVKDTNGTFILLGEEFGLKISSSFESGTKMADNSRWTIMLKGMEAEEPREVDAAIVPALIVPVV